MAYQVAAVGKSGTGKSTSLFPSEALGIIGLNPAETLYVNVSKKELPFKGARKLYPPGTNPADGHRDIRTDSPARIAKIIEAVDANKDGKYTHIKNIVVDDAHYLQSFTLMDSIKEEGWNKFNDTANAAYLPLRAATKAERLDLFIVFIYHSEKDDNEVKIKTAGKMVDAYLTIEGLFTVVLYTTVSHDFATHKSEYKFSTQNDGRNTGKSPAGMFDEFLIPNDMGYVRKKIQEFYE